MARNANIQVRRDTAANWTSVNPVLNAGEIGFETNTGKVKIGDGTTAWTSLTYATDSSKLVGLATSATTDTTNAGNITSGTLPNARLSAVPNSSLANSAVTVNGSSVSLGGSVTVTATPTAHASTHGVAGSDPVTIAPSQVTGTAVTVGPTSMNVTNVRTADWLAFSTATGTPGAARIQAREHCQWVRFPYAVTLDRLSIYVQTGGSTGAVVRLGIRNDDNGRPGTVLLDAGTAATTTSTSFATITVNQTLAANTTYWLSATAQGTPTTGAITRYPSNTWLPGFVGASTQGSSSVFGYYQNSVTGALPSTFTSAGDLSLGATDGYAWAVRIA